MAILVERESIVAGAHAVVGIGTVTDLVGLRLAAVGLPVDDCREAVGAVGHVGVTSGAESLQRVVGQFHTMLGQHKSLDFVVVDFANRLSGGEVSTWTRSNS